MPKRKRGASKGRGWSSLPWKNVEVEEGALGDADDCFVFAIEEIDGDDYLMEKDQLGGVQVKAAGASGEAKSMRRGDAKKAEPQKLSVFSAAEGDEPTEVEEVEYDDVGEEQVAVEDSRVGGVGDPDEVEVVGHDAAKTTKQNERQERKKQKKKRKLEVNVAVKEAEQDKQGRDVQETEDVEGDVQLEDWSAAALDGVDLHPLLLKNLRREGFTTPTPIQRLTLPAAIGVKGDRGKDVMGAAETGSGKTLAYGLPVLDHLLKTRDKRREGRRPGEDGRDAADQSLGALVLCPTRELALQVTAHLTQMLVGDQAQGRDRINIVSIVGGLSDIKQERLLKRRPEVVVATVGRLWELITANEPHVRDLSRLRFLVLDEADRMVESGHYPELTKIFASMVKQQKTYQQEYDAMQRQKREVGSKKTKPETRKDVEKKTKANKPASGRYHVQVNGEDMEIGDDESDEGAVPPAEVPTLTLEDVMRQAKRRGMKSLHGLEEVQERVLEMGEDDDDDIQITGEVEVLSGQEAADGDDDEKEGRPEEETAEEDEEDGEDDDHMVHTGGVDLVGKVASKGAVVKEDAKPPSRDLPPPVLRQTLVFSATLSMPEELRRKVNKRKGKKDNKKQSDDVMTRIMRQVGMRGKPVIIDLSNAASSALAATGAPTSTPAIGSGDTTLQKEEQGSASTSKSAAKTALALPSGLQLTYIKSVDNQKDVYPYLFLRRYPGRTIIFTNNIDSTKRLAQLLSILQLPARALHAKMQQRQRLKNLDAFKSQATGILVATDVAGRGLDIPLVEHVIHYDLPKSLEVFVHRSGRTARAKQEGLSFSIVGPRDERVHAEVCRTLLPTGQMPAYSVDLRELAGARQRVQLAGRIIAHERHVETTRSTHSWFVKSARDAGLELDEETLREEEQGTHQDKQKAAQLAADRRKLAELLSQPLVQERRKFVDVTHRLEQLQASEGQTAIEALARMVKQGTRG